MSKSKDTRKDGKKKAAGEATTPTFDRSGEYLLKIPLRYSVP